jgi:hypothetical protein
MRNSRRRVGGRQECTCGFVGGTLWGDFLAWGGDVATAAKKGFSIGEVLLWELELTRRAGPRGGRLVLVFVRSLHSDGSLRPYLMYFLTASTYVVKFCGYPVETMEDGRPGLLQVSEI